MPTAPSKNPSDGPKLARYLRFSLQCRVPITGKFIVPLAEMFRAAANSHLCKVFKDSPLSPALLGKDANGPLAGHRHAFYLPTAEDASQPGMLTDLHVWCPMGFTRAEVDVLLRIRRLNWGNGRFPENPVLIAMGMQLPPEARLAVGEHASHPLKSRIWRSATPFVPPLHFYRGNKANPKLKANASPEHQLAQILRDAGIATPVTIQRLPPWDIVRAPEGDNLIALPFDKAVEAEIHDAGSDSNRRPYHRRVGFFIQLTFDEPVTLPMPSLGHSAHFGLGLFKPET